MTVSRDPHFIARFLRIIRPILVHYYRAECHGFEKLGSGPYLLVANHSAGAAVEPLVLLDSWERADRKIYGYGMAHRFVYKIPGIRTWFWQLGAIPATHTDARHVLRRGETVLVFPGGDLEAMRPIWKAKECDFGGRVGWARIAIEENVSVVPIAISGSHYTNVIFCRSRWLAYLFIVPALLRITWYPITLSQLIFPPLSFFATRGLITPVGAAIIAYVIFLAAPLFAFFPAKITAKVLDPIPNGEFSSSDELYAEVVGRITACLKA